MTARISVTVRNSSLATITTAIGTSGLLRFYTGTQPATGGAETTKIAELPLSATAAPAPSAGVLTFNAITNATALVSGTPTWARLCTSAGAHVVDFTVGVSGADINFAGGTTWVAGGIVAVSSLTITDGNP